MSSITRCRVCESGDLEPVVDLGMQPWGNHFLSLPEVGKEPLYPLCVVYCHNCHLSQLDFTVEKEIMFSDHTYLSGTTFSLSQHFHKVATQVDKLFFSAKKKKSILDIGSNDGTQLKYYKALGYDVLGVEASKPTAKIANDAGIDTLNTFFDEKTFAKMEKQFDVINAAGVFFHLDELHSVCRAIKKSLKKEGVFIVQFLYMKSILENLTFDQIYHEHLLYYTLETLEKLLNMHGLVIFDASFSAIHGGSIIGYVGHADERDPTKDLLQLRQEEQLSNCNSIESYKIFSKRIEEVKRVNLAYIKTAKEKDKTIYGLGAPVKGNTLLNYFGMGKEMLDCLVEKNSLRKNLFSPGMHIPIRIEDEITEMPDIYYVLSWNIKNELLPRKKSFLGEHGEFYFPFDCVKHMSTT